MELKSNKFKNFFKRYGALVLAGVFTVAIALTVALTVTNRDLEVSTTDLAFQLPMNNAEVIRDYDENYPQYYDILNKWQIHLGVDLTSSTDTSVMSVLDGTVTDVYSNNLEGNVVEITHANGFVSTYSSLADGVLVSEGDEVTKGQKIGEASNTAGKEFDDEIALHFMLFKDGVEVDPNDYLDLGLK